MKDYELLMKMTKKIVKLTKLRIPYGKSGLTYVFSGVEKVTFSITFTNSRAVNSDLQLWKVKDVNWAQLFGVKQTLKVNGDTYEINTSSSHPFVTFVDQCPEFGFGYMNTTFRLQKVQSMSQATLTLSAMKPSQDMEKIFTLSGNNNFF